MEASFIQASSLPSAHLLLRLSKSTRLSSSISILSKPFKSLAKAGSFEILGCENLISLKDLLQALVNIKELAIRQNNSVCCLGIVLLFLLFLLFNYVLKYSLRF